MDVVTYQHLYFDFSSLGRPNKARKLCSILGSKCTETCLTAGSARPGRGASDLLAGLRGGTTPPGPGKENAMGGKEERG